MRKPRRTSRPGRARPAAIAATLVGALVLAACAPGAPTTPNPLAGQLTTRTVDIELSGSTTYSVDGGAALASGGAAGFELTYTNASEVTDIEGTLEFDAGNGVGPSLTLDITSEVTGMTGRATVVDPDAGVSTTVNGTVSALSVDDLGNVAGVVTSGTRSVAFSTESIARPSGFDPALETLLAAQGDWCADAQQRLAGLDPAEIPLASILNTREPTRDDFAGSKAVLTPLTVRTWSDTADVTAQGGEHTTISEHISCKTRAADHVATTGASTASSDAPCSTLNQRAIDLALAEMTPAQQAAATVPTLGPDVVRQTGSEWTTPLSDSVELSGNVLRAHALLTEWTDPTFVLFPDTIRGVHYCTTWSPAFAYTHLLGTIPAP